MIEISCRGGRKLGGIAVSQNSGVPFPKNKNELAFLPF